MTDALKPLVDLTRKYPEIEGQVIWAEDGDWAAQDDDAGLGLGGEGGDGGDESLHCGGAVSVTEALDNCSG